MDEAARLPEALAGALEYAHQHVVIRRDLTPENILLQAGRPVVADVGLALAVSNAGGAGHADRAFPRHAAVPEPRAGDGRPRGRRPYRPDLLAARATQRKTVVGETGLS